MAAVEKELAALEDHSTMITWRQGRVLVAVRDQKLHVEAGYAEFEDWVLHAAPWSQAYCAKVMLFARVFDEEKVARTAGVTRGYELIRWCELMRQDAKAIVVQDAVVAGRRFSQHTRRSLAEAIRRLLDGYEAESLAEMAEEIAEDPSTPAFERPSLAPLAPEVTRFANREIRDFVRHARAEGIDDVMTYLVKYQGEAWATFKVRAAELRRLFDG